MSPMLRLAIACFLVPVVARAQAIPQCRNGSNGSQQCGILSTTIIPTVPLAKGGFGQDVSTGLIPGRFVRVNALGAIDFSQILLVDLPTGIPNANLLNSTFVLNGATIALGASATNIPMWISDFGTGADGDFTCSGAVTLTRNQHYNNFTATAACVLDFANWWMGVRATLTQASGAVFHADGNSATAVAGAAGRNLAQYGLSGAGGSGGNSGSAAAVGVNALNSESGAGGAGGSGCTGATGTGGTVTGIGTSIRHPWMIQSGVYVASGGTIINMITGGAGGGGGCSSAGGTGGGGGGGAGQGGFSARHCSLAGTLRARGGSGAAGASAGNQGGGGGGGGGYIRGRCGDGTDTSTKSAAGGTGGTGLGAGATGTTGGTGVILVEFAGT